MKDLIEERLSVVEVIEAGHRAALDHACERPPYMLKSPDPIAELCILVDPVHEHPAPLVHRLR